MDAEQAPVPSVPIWMPPTLTETVSPPTLTAKDSILPQILVGPLISLAQTHESWSIRSPIRDVVLRVWEQYPAARVHHPVQMLQQYLPDTVAKLRSFKPEGLTTESKFALPS